MFYDLFSYVRSLNERRIKQLTRNIYFGKNFFICILNILILQRANRAFCNVCFRKQFVLINKALVIITYCVCRLVFFSLESLSFSNSLIQQRAAKVPRSEDSDLQWFKEKIMMITCPSIPKEKIVRVWSPRRFTTLKGSFICIILTFAHDLQS